MDASIVVTVRNAAAHLPNLLDDFEALDSPPCQVVIVDAFSTDGTWELLQDHAASSRHDFVLVQKVGGISAGRNEGFRHATADWVAVTDADMRVPKDWLHQLLVATGPGVGVVGGPNDGAGDDLTSRCIDCIPVHGPSLGIVPVVRRNKYDDDYETTTDIFAAVTRNSLIRREVFTKIGGFDETLKVTEDPELMRRVLDAGWTIRYRRSAGVRHVHRENLSAFYRQQRAYAVYQAHANKKHRSMRSLKHWAPLLAVATAVVSLAALPWVAWPAALVFGFGSVLTIGYAMKAAIVKRDAALLVALPWFFLAWQLAWATGFPKGVLGGR